MCNRFQQPQPLLPHLHTAKADSRSLWVIRFRKQRVRSMDTGMSDDCGREGVPYGRRTGGATFHTIRHTMATWLARLGYGGALHAVLMGHLSEATTRKYTHLAAGDQQAPLEALAAALPLVGPVVGLPPDAPAPRRTRRAATSRKAAVSTRSGSRRSMR
jgi:integrase